MPGVAGLVGLGDANARWRTKQTPGSREEATKRELAIFVFLFLSSSR